MSKMSPVRERRVLIQTLEMSVDRLRALGLRQTAEEVFGAVLTLENEKLPPQPKKIA